jgi:hypothetical protein
MSFVDIGKECSVGGMAVVLYDSKMENNSILEPLSVLMKSETLPANNCFVGVPASRSLPIKKSSMKVLLYPLIFLFSVIANGQPVFKNPGISESESFEIHDYLDNSLGYVNSIVNVSLKENNGNKYYDIYVNEGHIYSNEIKVNFNDLTTISEKRTDLRNNSVVEYFINNGNGIIYFYNKEKGIDKNFNNTEKNIYSRYAYFFSFRGFPFEVGKSVTFNSYMFEYGDVLPMKLKNLSKQTVNLKTGNFECYKLELSVSGWQSLFSSYKSYLYFAVADTHQFVKYEEMDEKGVWNADELIKTN